MKHKSKTVASSAPTAKTVGYLHIYRHTALLEMALNRVKSKPKFSFDAGAHFELYIDAPFTPFALLSAVCETTRLENHQRAIASLSSAAAAIGARAA